MGKNISDDNRYEHGAVRSNARMRIPVSGTEAAKQRSDAGTYTVCGTMYRVAGTVISPVAMFLAHGKLAHQWVRTLATTTGMSMERYVAALSGKIA